MSMLYAKRLDQDWEQRILAFLTEPELWERISADGLRVEDFELTFRPGVSYVGLFDASVLFGILILHEEQEYTYEAHINIQQEFRKDYSAKAGRLCMQYIAWQTSILKVNAQVPAVYKDVSKWLKKIGLSYEGLNRHSIMKGGKLVDQLRYGITILEIQELI